MPTGLNANGQNDYWPNFAKTTNQGGTNPNICDQYMNINLLY